MKFSPLVDVKETKTILDLLMNALRPVVEIYLVQVNLYIILADYIVEIVFSAS